MMHTDFPDEYFDCIVDVFSSNCLDEKSFERFIIEVKRILKSKGVFFSYTPAKSSDAFVNAPKSDFIDNSTLKYMMYKNQPYYGNNYPFRYMDEADIINSWKDFSIVYCEEISKTYFDRNVQFSFLTYEARKG